MLPLLESKWHSLHAVAPFLEPFHVAALKDRPREPLFYGLDLPEAIAVSYSLLALVRPATIYHHIQLPQKYILFNYNKLIFLLYYIVY